MNRFREEARERAIARGEGTGLPKSSLVLEFVMRLRREARALKRAGGEVGYLALGDDHEALIAGSGKHTFEEKRVLMGLMGQFTTRRYPEGWCPVSHVVRRMTWEDLDTPMAETDLGVSDESPS